MVYMGSKASIAKHILPIMMSEREDGQAWVEPFVGGGNMIDKVDGIRIGNDQNKYVIALLCAIRDGVIFPTLSKSEYAQIKKSPDEYLDCIVGYAGICCSYSGKWFGGYAGIVETKGGVRDYQSEQNRNIVAQSAGLSGCSFTHGSYHELSVPDNSIIYCDPPYAGTTGYKIKFDHDQFYDWCRIKKSEGHTIFVSEYNMPDDFKCIWQKEVKSCLRLNVDGCAKSSIEKLFAL